MKKNVPVKKLQIKKETVRALSDQELAKVVAGNYGSNNTCGWAPGGTGGRCKVF